jgi:hypothetical protein
MHAPRGLLWPQGPPVDAPAQAACPSRVAGRRGRVVLVDEPVGQVRVATDGDAEAPSLKHRYRARRQGEPKAAGIQPPPRPVGHRQLQRAAEQALARADPVLGASSAPGGGIAGVKELG